MDYSANTDPNDPLASPALSQKILAAFPPTLIMTGTRGWDMSAAVQTQRELTRAGVQADLHLWDGVGHCFMADARLPEATESIAVLAKFFDRHLGDAPPACSIAVKKRRCGRPLTDDDDWTLA